MSKTNQRKAFSMAEMIVVLTIIILLISLIAPSLVGIRYLSRHYQCSNNMKQVAYGFLDYATAHKQRLPGNCFSPIFDTTNAYFTPIDQRSWLYVSGPYPTNDYSSAPTSGTLFDFTGNKKMYRCPILPFGGVGTGIGSNGMFDYAEYNSFYGARVDMIRLVARFYKRTNPTVYDASASNMDYTKWDQRVTPILVEEDPYWNMNRNNVEADHSNYDVMGNWHQPNPYKGIGAAANYAAIDGSVQFFQRVGDYAVAKYVFTLTPSGIVRQCGAVGPAPYALWDAGIGNWMSGISSEPTW